MQGTVRPARAASAPRTRSNCGSNSPYPLRQPEAALADDREVARLPGEHVEVVEEPGGAWSRRRAAADRGARPFAAESSWSGGARDVADHHDPQTREVVDDRGADPRRRGGAGVLVLGVPVDAQQAGAVVVTAPGDEDPSGGWSP